MSTLTSPTPPIPSSASSSNPSTHLCVSLTATTVDEQLSQLQAARTAGATLIELRLDLLSSEEKPRWTEILSASSLPLIVTNRAAWEGGNASEPEIQRLAPLIQAVSNNVAFIDVELKALDAFWNEMKTRNMDMGNTKLIVSKHHFDRSMSLTEVLEAFQTVKEKRGHIAKVAMMGQSAMDNITAFTALQTTDIPAVVLVMGEIGTPSRILAPKYSAFLTFASVREGEGSAPGQVDVATMVNVYRFRKITSRTKVFAVIGNPVSQSMGPVLHNAAFEAADLDAVYVRMLVTEGVDEIVRKCCKIGFWGFSVTIPWKMDVRNAADELREDVKAIGAMNTVVREADGKLKGANSDWGGALDALCRETGGSLEGRRVLVMGAGGAGKALVYGAVAKGAKEVVVANRSKSKAITLAEEIGGCVIGIGNDEIEGDFDVIMNSTSVGMVPDVDKCIVDVNMLKEGMVVFDAVYNPMETKLLREARKRGAVCVGGVEMFVGQARLQFEMWFPGVEAPEEVMREKVYEKLGLSGKK